MNWKQIISLQTSKVILYIALILIFGVPATERGCSTLPSRNVDVLYAPRCIERFGFSNIVLDVSGFNNFTTTDATTHFRYNPIIILLYLVVLYLAISFVYYLSGYDWKKALLYVMVGIFIVFLFFIYLAFTGSRMY